MGKVLAQASATVGKLKDGADGKTSYIHVAYANSADGSISFSTTDPNGRAYVGTLTDFVEQDSTNYADYTWSLVKGSDGKDGANGLPGPKGADGRTSYVHFAYANSIDGKTNFSTTDPVGKTYVGTLTDFVEPDSTNPTDYTWSLIKGADGKNGADGRTGYIHVAYANSADGTDRFTTVYPNLNLLDGTKDFSGNWINSSNWETDGTYKDLTVKKRTGQWGGIYKTFTAPKDGTYTFSAYIKSSGNTANVYRFGGVNSTDAQDSIKKLIGNNFDWTRDIVTLNLKANDNVWVKYEISDSSTGAILWTAGHKWEQGSTATTWMPSSSEVTTADWPSHIGQYTDFTKDNSTNPTDYTWSLIKGDSVTVTSTSIQYAISDSGTSTPTQWSNSILAPEQGKFLWTRTTVTFSDGKSTVSYSIAFSGSDGKTEDISGIISSNTPPASPKDNQFWNDTSSVPNVLKVYRANNGWVVYQFSAENIASRSVTTDKLSANAVKAANIDMSEVTYQVADSSKNLAKNTSLSDVAGLPNSSGWTLPSGVTLVNNALGGTNGILVPAGTTATLVNDLWDATDAISDYVLGLWVKSAGVATITVDGVTAVEGGIYPITTAGDGVWSKMEIKYASTSSNSQLKLTVKAISDTYLARVMLSRRDTKLDGMWLPAPEDGMLNTAKLNDQVTQNFSLSNGQLKSIISNLNSGYTSNFTQNSDGTINQITKGNDLVTAINASPAGVYIKGNRIILDGTVNVTQDFYAKGGNFKNLNADNFTGGKVKADYIDVAAVVTQGLNTTNATIAKTLTMGNDGLITANLQTQTLTYRVLGPVGGFTEYPYTSTGTYKLDKTGFTISSKAVFEGNRPIVNVGGHAYGVKTYEPKLYINDASITLSSSNATGQETSQTIDGTSIPTTVVSITPYVISLYGDGKYTGLFTDGLATNGKISTNTLYISTDYRKTITIDNGNITMPGMASDGSRTKSLRTAHRQWSAWFGQKWDLFREGDVVYATVMAAANQDIPKGTTSDEALPSGYIPKWQDASVLISDVIGRDVGVVFKTGTGKMATIGGNSAPWTSRWSAVWFTGDPFPTGDIVQ